MSIGPLAGRVVVTTRGQSDDDALTLGLRRLGAEVRHWATATYPPPADPGPLAAVLSTLSEYDCVVFTSARAVGAIGDPPTSDAAPVVAVVGPATERAAAGLGWSVAVVGRGPGAHGLAEEVARVAGLSGARVLFPAAAGAAATIEDEFGGLGAHVHRVEAYRTVIEPPDPALVDRDLAAGVAAVTFASPSAVEAVACSLGARFVDALGDQLVVCIGPTTKDALTDRGVTHALAAKSSTMEGIIERLLEEIGTEGPRGGAVP